MFTIKTKTKKVYYCDFCNKNGLSRYYMDKHEKDCTLNPSRNCKVCDNKNANEARLIIKKYKDEECKAYFRSFDFIVELKKELNGCPLCVLSVLRCLEVHNFNFDYKEGFTKWEENNANRT